ncbi:Pro-kumamolisin, activation domain [Teratosphaeria destructans]|uniref:Pro-kumamolisin, activation domain n=1 Tax=Teratosphaeria destructans TaxID=418781 RepID=A0A9W7W1M4_9PEZI|nr:Pro-kumamolisin, activation domain [Teratosphaeria destructans]
MPSHLRLPALLLALLGAAPAASASPYAVKERHWVPRGWRATGPASKSKSINLQIGLRQRREGSVERHLLEISDPDHARYGQHLTAAEVRELVAPADDTVDLVREWLSEHEISNAGFSPSKDWVSIVVPIEKAEQLLQTSYSTYRHHDGSEIDRAIEWSLPAHLHEHVDVVQPTTSFFKPKKEAVKYFELGPKHPMSWWESTGKQLYGGQEVSGTHAEQVAAVCNVSFTTPTCLRTLYGTLNYTAQANGTNKMGLNNYLNETNYRADVYKFLQLYRPEAAEAAYDFDIVTIADAPNDQGPYTAAELEDETNVEANLDAQQMLSIGYPTPLTAFSTGGSPPFVADINTPTDTNEPYLTWLNYALAQDDLPQVISSSYGDDEQTVPESYAARACSQFAQLGARGITFLVSSGDAGVGADDSCYTNDNSSTYEFLPSFPTGCPWVTSVGATANFNPETAVSRFASGAGFSNYFGQRRTKPRSPGGPTRTSRPRATKTPLVWDARSRPWAHLGVVADLRRRLALVNDALIAAGKSPLGFLNPWLYKTGHRGLTDITSGSSYGCNTAGFPAQAGWDAVTGFGTPNFGALVRLACGGAYDE